MTELAVLGGITVGFLCLVGIVALWYIIEKGLQ